MTYKLCTRNGFVNLTLNYVDNGNILMYNHYWWLTTKLFLLVLLF